MNILEIVLNGVKDTIVASIVTLNGASGWLMISFILAGVLHNVLLSQECFYQYVVVE